MDICYASSSLLRFLLSFRKQRERQIHKIKKGGGGDCGKQLLVSQLFILQQHQGQRIDKLEEPVCFCSMLIFPGIKIGCNPSLPDLILFPKNYGLYSYVLCTRAHSSPSVFAHSPTVTFETSNFKKQTKQHSLQDTNFL